jgi:hypothetical protein
MNITVCTLAINDWYQDIVKYAVSNLKNYCETHNYKFVIDYGISDTVYDKSRQEPWYKILLIEKLLIHTDSEYIVWIDADCQIMNPEIKLEYFINKYFDSSDIELVLTQDNNVFNTGVMFIKKSDFNKKLMKRIWDNTDGNFFKDFQELTAFADLYENNIDIKNHVKIIPYGLKDELVVYWGNYYPGEHFLLHSARCTFDRIAFMYMMDLFYIYKLEEETEDQYKKRLEWINNKSICRSDIDKWLVGENISRNYSMRCLIYMTKIQIKN